METVMFLTFFLVYHKIACA